MAIMDIIGFFKSMSAQAFVIRGIGYGLVLASLVAFFISQTNRTIVKRLLAARAFSRDSALGAEKLGAKKGVLRFALRDRSPLRKTVKATDISEVPDDAEKRYYIPEENAPSAESRYVKRNSPVAWIVGTVLLAAATEGAIYAVPWIISLF